MSFSSWCYYTSSTSSVFVFSSSFHTLGKSMELLNLDSIKFIQTEISYSEAMMFTSDPHFTFAFHHPLMFSMLNVPVYPSVHVCASGCQCAITLRGRICVWTPVCVCILCVCLRHYVQPCSCVSRVDVLKWGHFLSVWCLRNNPTAQKLLQPSASTYLSLYLYCYAFMFDYCPLHAVWLSACYDTIT